ncbi:hypothetical protein HY947_05715 [Candidatus Gottesmanbacteria bacterium]|nr:hypothetical protein [Candidatus Gottesmanbacteria bacterium]
MKKVMDIIRRKPATLTLIVVVFLIASSLLKWRLRPPIDALWYLVGGGIGMYFLDAAEEFFHLVPSPFKTVVFFVLFVLVSFFVTTSSGNVFASGLVFSLYLCLLSSQIGEFVHMGDVSSWYRMVDAVPAKNIQQIALGIFVCLFLIQTFLFVR